MCCFTGAASHVHTTVYVLSTVLSGSIYEYSLELASQTSAPSLEKHTAKLASVVAAQAEELRKQHNKDKLPVPGVVLFGKQ